MERDSADDILHRVQSEAVGSENETPVSTYQIDPEQMAELSAKLTEEGRAYMKAYKKFKDSFFSQLDDDVSIARLMKLQIYLVH